MVQGLHLTGPGMWRKPRRPRYNSGLKIPGRVSSARLELTIISPSESECCCRQRLAASPSSGQTSPSAFFAAWTKDRELGIPARRLF